MPEVSKTVTLANAVTKTASEFAGAGIPLHGSTPGVVVYVIVTAVSGTSPTLQVGIQDSPDGVSWATAVTSAVISAPGTYRIVLSAPLGNHIRHVLTIGGTIPSFTFSIVAVVE